MPHGRPACLYASESHRNHHRAVERDDPPQRPDEAHGATPPPHRLRPVQVANDAAQETGQNVGGGTPRLLHMCEHVLTAVGGLDHQIGQRYTPAPGETLGGLRGVPAAVERCTRGRPLHLEREVALPLGEVGHDERETTRRTVGEDLGVGEPGVVECSGSTRLELRHGIVQRRRGHLFNAELQKQIAAHLHVTTFGQRR